MGLIKVLHVVTKMDKGGLETRLMDIIKNIDRTKVDIDIYTNSLDPGFYDEEIISLGSKIFKSNQINLLNPIKKIIDFRNFLLKHPEYKIVHIQMNELSTLYCIGAYYAKVPVRIVHARGANKQNSLKNRIKKIIKQPINRYATHMFSVSKPAAISLFGKTAYRNGDVRIIPNAIDTKKFLYNPKTRMSMRKELGLKDTFTLIHVGNFTHAKNHEFLIDVFIHVKKIIPDAVLVLVGAGENKLILEKIQKNNLQKCTKLLGSRKDVQDVLQAGDVFVFPSLYEGLPGAVVEAQAAGLPCLISQSITEEVCILPTTKQLSLNDSKEKWAEEIIKMKNIERTDTSKTMIKEGFDIRSLIKDLEHKYKFYYNNI